MITTSVNIGLMRCKRSALLAFMFIVAGMLLPYTVHALTYATEYKAHNGQPMTPGMIVVTNDKSSVELAKFGDGKRVLGAVAAISEGILPEDVVGVTSSGVSSVLVSDLNGEVKAGDAVSVSLLDGVAAKTSQASWIIGTAQADFGSRKRTVTQQVVKTADGSERTVAIRAIPVLLSVSYFNPSAPNNTGVASAVQAAANTIAGREVSSEKLILALVVFGIAIILLVTLVYSAVRNSLLSIGRNPLAQAKISANLVKVLAIALIVVMAALGIIYLILR